MSQLQPVWTSGDYCKVSFKSKDVALSLTNLCVHKTDIQLALTKKNHHVFQSYRLLLLIQILQG